MQKQFLFILVIKIEYICSFDFDKNLKFANKNNRFDLNFKQLKMLFVFLKSIKRLKMNLRVDKIMKKKIMLIKSPFHYKYSKHILEYKNGTLSMSFKINTNNQDINFKKIFNFAKSFFNFNFFNYPNLTLIKYNFSYLHSNEKYLKIW